AIETADRTVGARIAGRLQQRQDANPGRKERVTIRYSGSAGQSFGAFAVDGMSLALEGQANDYVGKGMNGGEVAIFPWANVAAEQPQVLAGNTILYGATGGSLFIAGKVGERFMVRNSGATAVV